MKHLASAICLLVCVSLACTVSTPEPSITDTREIAQQTLSAMWTLTSPPTDTPIATNTSEPSPLPTDTQTPINTSEPSPSPTDTQTPTDTPVPTPLPDRIEDPHGVEMALVHAGEFGMGQSGRDDADPYHKVTLDAFYMDIYEVTNALFAEFVQDTGYKTQAEKSGGSYVYVDGGHKEVEGADWQHPLGPTSNINGLGDHPVLHISWNDAQAYCEWRDARLPTEAEWEKAARGGLKMTYQKGEASPWEYFPWGKGTPVCQAGAENGARFDDNDRCDDLGTAPVGTYSPNGYGLYDMAGNVCEWVQDWYYSRYYWSSPSENPLGPSSGNFRVLRGGSWFSGRYYQSPLPNWGYLNVAFRYWYNPGSSNNYFGFRCAAAP